MNSKYKKSVQDMIYLISCLFNSRRPGEAEVGATDKRLLYEAAKSHGLLAVTAMALEAVGVRDPEFEQAKWKAIRRSVLFNTERGKLLSGLEEKGIWYMPLKGVYMQNYYPKAGMREMSDNDILIDPERADDVKEVMLKCGYKLKPLSIYGSGYDDEYIKPPVLNFEMHRKLFDENQKGLYKYYKNVKERLIKDDDNKFGYHFSNEDFYIYFIAHEYVHYFRGGTGIRSLLDTYVFMNRFKDVLDMEYISSQMKILGMTDFEKKNRLLADKVFGGIQLSSAEAKELEYYIFSGTYGNVENFVANEMQKRNIKKQDKIRYLAGRLFLPMDVIKASYPFFYKHKLLLPFFVLYRIIKFLTVSRERCIRELKYIMKKDK